MKIDGRGVKIDVSGARVTVDFGTVSTTFNARQIALVKEGFRRKMDEKDPYVWTLSIFGTRDLLKEYTFETEGEMKSASLAFTVAMGAR